MDPKAHKFVVTYPLITTEGRRVFATRAEAEAFANERRNATSPYLSIHAWRQVKVEEIQS